MIILRYHVLLAPEKGVFPKIEMENWEAGDKTQKGIEWKLHRCAPWALHTEAKGLRWLKPATG